MVREIARYLAFRDWQVNVVVGYPHHPHGKLYDGWTRSVFDRQIDSGVQILRTWHWLHPSRKIPVRGAVFVSQAVGTTLGALTLPAADIILVYGPPLVGPCLGALLKARHHAKLVNVVYDIYPDVAIETGKVTHPVVVAAARVAERAQYRASDMTIVLSEGFKALLAGRGVPPDKIAVVPVWLDPAEVKPMDRDNAWRREHGIPLEKFVVLYAGTIGIVSGARMVADAAAILRGRNDILFLFVGEGEEKAALQARAKQLGLSNMRFLPIQPRARLSELQATADVGLVTLAPGRGRTSVPSKVLGYMAAGRPIIACVDQNSDTATELVSQGAGVVVPPGDPTALVRAVLTLAADPEARAKLGAAARAGMAKHAPSTVLEAYANVLASTLR